MFEDDLTELAAKQGWPADALNAALELWRSHRRWSKTGTQADTYLDDPNQTTDSIGSEDLPNQHDVQDPHARYEVLDLLGEGGMGAVYRVRDRELNRYLAMKVIKPKALTSTQGRSRFVGEAQATAQLQHPGIVPVHELGKLVDGRWYYTMPQIRGVTLTKALRGVHRASFGGTWQESPSGWTLRRLVDAFRAACEAMGYAHSRGVVHRDLKPDNVMLGAHGEVLVVDWGIAKILGTSDTSPQIDEIVTGRSLGDAYKTQAGSVAGTPAYMPPEQAMGEQDRITSRSDVWSLGAILYEILYGRPPYSGPSGMNVLMQVVRGPPSRPHHEETLPGFTTELESTPRPPTEPPEPTDFGPRPPGELVDIWVRAMSSEPEDRFDDAGALADELAAWLDGAKRREQARVVVERANDLEPDVAGLRAEAAELRTQAAGLLDSVEPWEPESRKLPGWELEDQAEALERKADRAEFRANRLLHGALTHAPDLIEAHLSLARRYHHEHREAELTGRHTDAIRAEDLLKAHVHALPDAHTERARFGAYLKGDGALSLTTDPPGAIVQLYRYERQGRRQQPVGVRSLGPTPIRNHPLPMGSYLLEITAPGRADVHYPVLIDRQHHWDGVPPGHTEPHAIKLPLADELGPDDCYVPAGWFWVGGDAAAEIPVPRQRVWADGFLIRRFPVTNRAYIAFLDHLVDAGREADALAWAPRERGGAGGVLGPLVYGRTASGHFELQPDSEGDIWDLDWPVLMVDHACARGYASWLAETTGRPWTLPAELQWEKAARGADGRIFPWGDQLDPCWCCMDDSHAGRRLPAVVDSFPVDVSVYGVRGLAGNIQDWCADQMLPEGPVLTDGRVSSMAPVETGHEARINARGGMWTGAAHFSRCTGRQGGSPAQRLYTRGIRVLAPFD